MRRIFIILMGFLLMCPFLVEANAQEQKSQVRVRRTVIRNNVDVRKAPYHGDAITSSYNDASALFTLWFHYAAENVEVLITKDGETVMDETFDMSANELLECDFSDCESGEYAVYVAVDGVVQVVKMLNVY